MLYFLVCFANCLCHACKFITIFSTAFGHVTHVTMLVLVLTKSAPGGDLIRVDLIRFPGSIPGGI